jgi:hypothetical protein
MRKQTRWMAYLSIVAMLVGSLATRAGTTCDLSD